MENTSVKCPNCKEVFKVDETSYSAIIKQVRDEQFEADIKNRLDLAEKEKLNAVQLAEVTVKNNLQASLVQKDRELEALKASSKNELLEKLYKKEQQLTQLKASNQQLLIQKLAEKDAEIARVHAQLQNADTLKTLEVSKAVSLVEKERDQLVNTVQNKETEKQLLEKSIKEQFQLQLVAKEDAIKLRDDEIERLKDFKQKQSTKMVGESLEQHCEVEFNKLRATGFQNAYFEKDNDARAGTKGDYIYKETDSSGNEVVSIMFEMKNENDQTATKKKNEDFFAKLDKDRKDKGCEYAILVSLLEADNEFYNTGIVDVSYKYPKMYVVRPQFFIPIITLLRNAGLNSLSYKQELEVMKNENMDITNFENKIEDFKTGFARNYELASRQFKTAIDEIDKTMSHLQKTKDSLLSSVNNLRLANNKAADLSIKKLTNGNATMKEKFKEIK